MGLKNHLTLSLALVSITAAHADSLVWQVEMAGLGDISQTLLKEEKSLLDQVEILEGQSKVQEDYVALLKQRVASLDEKLSQLSSGNDFDTAASEGLPVRDPDTSKLIAECAERIVILNGRNGSVCTAFLGLQNGKTAIYAPAAWVAGNAEFSVTDLKGNDIPVTRELSCPVGIGLVGLHPENPGQAHLDLATADELPTVGDRIVVIVADTESKVLTGQSGTIRGIGPDTFELDAELTPGMSGAPVLDSETGKVIGIVAHQVAGVADDWAVGTRHQESRDFALRLDRVTEWEKNDLGRFAKEAAYIQSISRKSEIAWIAHTLIECELKLRTRRLPFPRPSVVSRNPIESYEEFQERRRKVEEQDRQAFEKQDQEFRLLLELINATTREADGFPGDPYITQAQGWIKERKASTRNDPGGELDPSLTKLYRQILADLEKEERDLSAHLSWYHKDRYRSAVGNRAAGIRVISSRANRVGR